MRKIDYDKYKDYQWDFEILRKISSISNNKGKIEVLQNQYPLVFEKMIVGSSFESIVASNTIEGIVTTDFRFKKIINEQATPKNRSEQEITGYKKAFKTIHESYKYIDITPNYILQLHKILYDQVSVQSFGGMYKNVQNYITAFDSKGQMFTLFAPVDPFETPGAIEMICREYNQMLAEEHLNPLILSIIFILDFLSIHPFNDGNGRVSRLLTILILNRLGYTVGRYVSIEHKINRSKENYYSALYASQRGWHEGTNNPLPLIDYMLSIIELAYDELHKKIERLTKPQSAYEMVKQSIAGKLGKITKSEVLDLCPTLSASSVEKSIHTLVKEGKLKKQGSGKNTFYIIKNI